MIETVSFELNGEPVEFSYETDLLLMWVLRTNYGLTGTKFGCGMGFCGSCTVVIDGKAVRSCMIPVSDMEGKRITTIEGLTNNGNMHPIQKAFVRNDALQCGYCTPGMIMNAYGLLLSNPEPSRQEIIDAMEENLCRCGAHGRIIKSIQEAAVEMKGAVRV